MSFILDALKKSEQERDRQQQPTVADIPFGRRSRSQPVWMIAVILLLVLNCILLLVMWWRSDDTPAAPPVATSAVTSSVAPAQQPAAQAPTIISPPRTAQVRPLDEEAGSEVVVADETAEALDNEILPVGPPMVRPATALEQAMAAQESRASQLKNNSAGNIRGTVDNIPTLDGLGGSGALNLPPLRLDVHVYSSVPAERFAFINTRKYTEGQSLTDGPILERITQDGAVLNYRGKRFLLPRQ